MVSLVRTVAPTTTPVSLDEAKAHLREDSDDQDSLIESLIKAATDHLDGITGVLGRALIGQTWRIDMAQPYDKVRLPLAPVQSVASVKYWDGANADQTWDAGNYAVYSDAHGPYLSPLSGISWPTFYDRPDALRIEFVAGYGAAADVPAAIKQAILLLVGHWFRNREAVAVGDSAAPLPLAVEALISPCRRWTF